MNPIINRIGSTETVEGGQSITIGNEFKRIDKLGNEIFALSTSRDVWFETKVKVGDVVVLPTMGFTKLEHKGDEFYIGQENQILARLKNSISIEDVICVF